MSTASPPTPPGRNIMRNRQAGEGRFQAFIWFLIVVWVFLAVFEFLPIRYRVSEFEDAIKDAGERGGQTEGDAARIKGQLLWRATQLDLPVTKDNLSVESNSSFIRINSSYNMPVKMPFYTYNWAVTHELRRKVFRF